jgi:predicted TPR repeat methyltransferase
MSNTKNTIQIFDKYAKQYQEKYMNVDLYSKSLIQFCDAIKTTNPDILELACGSGNITKFLLKQRSDFKISAADLSKNMIALAKENNPKVTTQILDCKDISSLNKKYKGIMCGFCLPYLSKKETFQLIKDASNILKPEGVFYISTMEDDYSKSGFQIASSGNDKMYMYFHEEDYLVATLKENSFKILDIQRKTYQNQDKSITTDLLILAKK